MPDFLGGNIIIGIDTGNFLIRSDLIGNGGDLLGLNEYGFIAIYVDRVKYVNTGVKAGSSAFQDYGNRLSWISILFNPLVRIEN